MRAGFAALIAAYLLSQYTRAFLAVLAPTLEDAVGATADDLALASGFWFAAFALMQLPIGAALDRAGPRRTAAALHLLGGAGGAALFAVAAAPWQVMLAMGLIGAGCAPVLMAAYYILARDFPPALFATLGGAIIGLGSLGNLLAAAPTLWGIEALGWRGLLWALAAAFALIAGAIALTVRDPAPADGGGRGSVLDLLRTPALWPILLLMAVNYAPAAGLRGLWIGPFMTDLHGPATVGAATLAMAIAMIAGSLLYGPLERLARRRKPLLLAGNLAGAATCLLLAAFVHMPAAAAVACFALIGLAGGSYPVMMAHGRAFMPAHLTGRGVTLMNLFSIGGAGAMQAASGPVFRAAGGAPGGYAPLLAFFGLALLAGCAAYLLAREAPLAKPAPAE
ncbi:putative MFS family arabinose efflux permease [Hasllibacter halocynthiae]|uniref:Putative MFS family arabinose efflux permease n=1 Tax=Hasllibacter halocynthiae TaxID=595589 RepID=A0A2T0X327_9RHOB|nr:MFS transporter [Hasllibacter halocynthiae]PRY93340.1 putative MFS family arabinose efflux permease [Hasllibacter halocynthiae]